jgi:monoamine oxidase
MGPTFDVAIIGAGASGLIAAWEIAKTGRKVIILEARDRTGGRVHSISDPHFEAPVELGAEFIHGDLEITQLLLKKAGIGKEPQKGNFWRKENDRLVKQQFLVQDDDLLSGRFKKLDRDITVEEFIANYLQGEEYAALRDTLRTYVEGYYAGDPKSASTFALMEEWNAPEEKQHRVKNGYGALIHWLEKECLEKNVVIRISDPVSSVEWTKDQVRIHAATGIFEAQKLLVTIPVGLWQNDGLEFRPALPGKKNAALNLGYGMVIKLALRFTEPFWLNKNFTGGADLEKMAFLFSNEEIPTWWTQYPVRSSLITGWCSGPNSLRLQNEDEDSLLRKGINSLANIFSVPSTKLEGMLVKGMACNWNNDPWSKGGYSYEVVNGPSWKKILGEPVADTIFITGEGLQDGPQIGTVEAALNQGRETAFRLISTFKK